MRVAFHLARRALPEYSGRFSRHDFSLPQLFACLVVREMLGLSYRRAEALLADCPDWLTAVGLTRAPDHNTLCRANAWLLRSCRVRRLLDAMARLAARVRMLRLSTRPLAVDASHYEDRHVSRYFEFRRGRGGGRRGRRAKVKSMPKLSVAVASGCHLVLSAVARTGCGSDHPDYEPLVLSAWARVPHRRFRVVADAGYDGEHHHRVLRQDMGLASVVPPTIGRPTTKPPGGCWRRHMARLLRTKAGRRRCGYTQRWQVETVNSMMKRNQGSALRGKTSKSRERDLLMKVLAHNVMVLR